MPLLTVLEPLVSRMEPFYAPPSQAGRGFEAIRPICCSGSYALGPLGYNDDDEFNWRLDCEETENFGVTRVRCDKPCSLLPHPVHQALIMVFPLAGIFEATVGGISISARRGQVLLLSTAQATHAVASPENVHAHISVHFPKIVVDRVHHSLISFLNVDVNRLFYVVDLEAPIGNFLYRFTKLATHDLFGKQYLRSSPTIGRRIAEIALNAIFDGYVNHSTWQETVSAHVGRAVKYIHDNLHQPLTISSIAEAAGTSPRSLQSAFRDEHGLTPMAYLRKARLASVHAELGRPDNRLSVGEVAFKWGFTHFGRFSSQYRAEFGESPSDTRKKK